MVDALVSEASVERRESSNLSMVTDDPVVEPVYTASCRKMGGCASRTRSAQSLLDAVVLAKAL